MDRFVSKVLQDKIDELVAERDATTIEMKRAATKSIADMKAAHCKVLDVCIEILKEAIEEIGPYPF